MNLGITKVNIHNINTDLNKEELRSIYTFLISFFIGLLKPVKPSDLQYYITKNRCPNLQPYFNKLPKQIRQRISDFAKKNRELLGEFLTGQNLIDQARQSRYDLYKILITQQGRDWSKRFMRYIQNLILTL